MDYSALQRSASALISKFGRPATLRRYSKLIDSSVVLTVDATAKTITRSTGSWLSDGFAFGQTVVFSGFSSAANNGSHIITTAAALVLTFSASTFADEADAIGINAESTTDYACNAVDNSPGGVNIFASSLIEGSLVSESDRFFLITAEHKPMSLDKLILGSETYIIHAVRPTQPGEIAVYYEVRARG